ncbi:MAG: PAS domain S-box protein [Novosphingobium sp.]
MPIAATFQGADLLANSITDYAICLLDTRGCILSWNAGATILFGYARDEMIGRDIGRLVTPSDRAVDDFALSWETTTRLGRFETNAWRLHKDGGRVWVNLITYPVRDVDGKLLGFSQVMRDLTEGREAEEALQQGAETFRMLVEGVTDYAIYMLDPTGHITSWNAGAERFKGYTAKEIIGQHFSRFYTPEDVDRDIPTTALRTALEEGHFEAEGWRVRKNGDRFWASVVIDPIRDNSGKLVGFAKITRDMTEQREAQIQLEQTREAFFHAQKMDAIGKLTGGVAHDFNNLLAAILGSLELAQRRQASGRDIGPFLDNAKQAAERGAELTQRMLAFARKQELKLEPVDVIGVIKGLAGLLSRTIGPGIEIDTQFPLLLPPVRADASQLELAVLNLLVNARDAMPDGGNILISGRISSEGEAGLAKGGHVCLSIADEGMGMDQETLARAAEPFFTTKGVGKGTGLGLSMVQGMVEQCGGRFVLTSREGKGTTAEVWLPLDHATSSEGPRSGAGTEQETQPVQSMRILAVDDDIIVLMNTATILEDMGHQVLEASSGIAALETLRNEPGIDLLVTDFAMPGMTGGELISAARELRPGLPVILLSGYVDLPDGQQIDAGRISKPFTERELALGIAAVMKGG